MRRVPIVYNIRPQDVSSENLENLNNGNYCVMLMLCFRIACIHVLPVKAIPEPSLEVVCLHASFFWTASDPDLKQNLYVKNPSSNGNDIRRFPAGT